MPSDDLLGNKEVRVAVICESYRESMMALIDGELPDSQRNQVESHLCCCPNCEGEYSRYLELIRLTEQLHPISNDNICLRNYWRGVCRKMERRAGWAAWSAGALILILAGNLMIFGFHENLLARALAALSLGAGACVLWLSYFCNCKK